jgi:hypothetical protein
MALQGWDAPIFLEFQLNPLVGRAQSFLKLNAGLPPKRSSKEGIVAVPATNALRLAGVVSNRQLL